MLDDSGWVEMVSDTLHRRQPAVPSPASQDIKVLLQRLGEGKEAREIAAENKPIVPGGQFESNKRRL